MSLKYSYVIQGKFIYGIEGEALYHCDRCNPQRLSMEILVICIFVCPHIGTLKNQNSQKHQQSDGFQREMELLGVTDKKKMSEAILYFQIYFITRQMQFRPTYNALQSYKDRNFEFSQYKRM